MDDDPFPADPNEDLPLDVPLVGSPTPLLQPKLEAQVEDTAAPVQEVWQAQHDPCMMDTLVTDYAEGMDFKPRIARVLSQDSNPNFSSPGCKSDIALETATQRTPLTKTEVPGCVETVVKAELDQMDAEIEAMESLVGYVLC